MPYNPRTKRPKYLPKRRKRKRNNSEAKKIRASRRWRLTSEQQRHRQPLCECCIAINRYQPARQVDHMVRLTDGGAPFSRRNLMSICIPHHTDKNVMESKGYKPEYIVTDNGLIPMDRHTVIGDVLRGYAIGHEDEDNKGEGGTDLWIN